MQNNWIFAIPFLQMESMSSKQFFLKAFY